MMPVLKKYYQKKNKMNKTRKFIIDGKNFRDIGEFYDEFEKIFLKNYPKKFKFGRNLDAFDDILYPDENERKNKWIIIWKNFNKSKKELPKEFLGNVFEILNRHRGYIKFKIEK